MARPPYVQFHVRPDGPGRRVGAAAIVRAVGEGIDRGELPLGVRLPPVRALEQQLGISKNTVQVAYDELVARGRVVARPREGVFVAGPAPEFGRVRTAAAAPAAVRLRAVELDDSPRPRPGVIALSTVFIDPDLLPRARIEACLRAVASSPRGLRPFYDPHGHPGLRALIAERLRARGMDVDAEDVILTTGSQQALDIVARSLADRHIATEDPVYSHARALFESIGARVTGLRLDPFAPAPLDEWARTLEAERPSLLYVITSFQNPTGYSYATCELERLIELSARTGVALIEDDWGSDMLSGTEYRPTLRALGGPEVLYVNSFTKKLWPSLRVGYLVANAALRPALVDAKRVSTLANAGVTEAILYEFLARGYYDTHLETLQSALDARYRACLGALRDTMPDDVRWTTPGGGPTLWLELPSDVDAADVRARLAAVGVLVDSPRRAFYGKPHLSGFRISYAFLSEATMRIALDRVAKVLHEVPRISA